MRSRLQGVETQHDLIVIGGGINGAGVARDAALRGYRVALVEKGDFASGASSKTSKLVHGGLRYLEQGALRLVWEACHERAILLRLAPHLVRPLPFVFPVYRSSRVGTLRLRCGMWLYDLLAGFRNIDRHRMLSLRGASSWGEGLRRDGLRGAALYYDAAMDDARLVLANVLAAREAGAVTLNGVAAEQLVQDGGRVVGVEVRDTASGEHATFRASCVVVCAGPWTNAFLAPLPGAPRPLAPTRGTHLVVRRFSERAFTLAAGDGRIFFVLPWLGLTLVGTTDVVDDGDPDTVAPTSDEVDYLLAETARHFPEAHLGRDDVLGTFAGLRPLLGAAGSASARSREHAVLEPMAGLLAVGGGKYTTYRAVAEEVVDRVEELLASRAPCRTARNPLPGGDLPWGAEDHWSRGPRFRAAADALVDRLRVPEATAQHLLETYGSRAERVAALAAAEPALAAPLCPHHPHLLAEALYAVREEMALTLADWFLRRSRTAYSACHGLDALPAVAEIFAAELGWEPEVRDAEIERGRQALEAVTLVTPVPATSRAR
jgi:glycerol-3-phosphate dehydrogenase